MADKYVQVRQQLENKLFSRFARNVTFKKLTTPSYTVRGDLDRDSSVYKESAIRLLDYDIFGDRRSYQSFGEVSEDQRDAVIPFDVDITTDDLLLIDGVDYIVRNVESPRLPEVIVNIVRIEKVQS